MKRKIALEKCEDKVRLKRLKIELRRATEDFIANPIRPYQERILVLLPDYWSAAYRLGKVT